MKIINQIKKTFGKELDFVIFFVTSKCNSRCRHCFFWKELNNKDELDLEEINKIFKNFGKIRDVALSGGEPILRKDILEVIDSIYVNSKINSLSIPSNGILTKKLLEVSEKILKKYPCLKLIINISLDGNEKIHDYIRGKKGTFKKAVSSVQNLIKLRENYENFYVNINSVIVNKNIGELPEFMEYVKKNLDVDGHYFEVMRGIYKDKDLAIPQTDRLSEFYKKALENEEFYFQKRFNKKRVGLNLGYGITRQFYIGIIKFLYRLQMNAINSKKWPFPCLAGITSLVIYPKGEISVCELKSSSLNIKDFDYDIKKLMKSQEWESQTAEIKYKKCFCTHDCFIYNTINHTPLARFIYLPLNYYKKWK